MLFRNSYMTPGPGVNSDTPRKTGLPRFFELMGRDLPSMYKASILLTLSALPAFLAVGFGLHTNSILITLAAALVTGPLVGPFLYGLFDTMARALRDEAGYWWPTYRRTLKENWKSTLLSGMVFTLVVSIQMLVCTTLLESGSTSIVTWVIMALNLFLGTGFYSYYWAQLVLLNTTLAQRVKNCCLMFIAFLPQTLVAAVVQVFYWGVIYLMLPVTLVVFLAFGFWLPVLIALMLIYPSMDRVLKIESTLAQRHQDDYQGEIDWGFESGEDQEPETQEE